MNGWSGIVPDGEALERLGSRKRPPTDGTGGPEGFGKANFLEFDGRSQIQIYVRKDALSERDFARFKLFDFGDCGVSRTVANEAQRVTIWALSLSFLAKCFFPLPRSGTGSRTWRCGTGSATST